MNPIASLPLRRRSLLSALLLLFSLSPVQGQDVYHTITNFAGSGTQVSADGTGPAASFNTPVGIAVDASGNVFVADYNSNKIRKITPAGVVTTLAGSGISGNVDGVGTAARFNSPAGIALDGSGNLYVADSSNHTIRKVTPNGTVTTFAGSGSQGSTNGTGTTASFYLPKGVAVDPSGNVIVADFGNHKIRKITPSGAVGNVAGSGSLGNTDGTGAAASFNYPNAVAVDGNGIIYVADTGNHRLRRIAAGGVVTTWVGSTQGFAEGQGGFAKFNNPYGIAADSAGNVFVADTYNHAIRRIIPGQITMHVAGGSGEGDATGYGYAAKFKYPQGLAVAPNGTLYISDTKNHRIKKGVLLPSQTITFPTLPDRVYGDPPFNVTASSSSGLAPAFIVESGPATLSGSLLTITGTGTVTVEASQSGNANYSPAPTVSRQFSVTPASQTITFNPLDNKTYGDAPFPVTATSSSGLPVSFSISVSSGPATVSGNTITLTGVGTVTVRATQQGNGNYNAAPDVLRSFDVAKGSQTISFNPIPHRLFGKNTVSMSATATSALQVSYSVVSGPATLSGSTLTITGPGVVTVKAAQAGSTKYLPAPDVTQSFTVFPNTTAPSGLALSKRWFYDNSSLNTVIGALSAVDPDAGDTISYSLVSGTGSTDNAMFNISGGQLRTDSTAFNYDTKRKAYIRVRAADTAGQFTEYELVLDLVDATPWAKFDPKNSFPQAPSYVNVIFQLKDNSNPARGINLPADLFEQTNDIFQVKENGTTISQPESFLQVNKIEQVPAVVRTILLLDTSTSVGANLATIKTAAKSLVDSMFDQQEIAIYSFSSSNTMVQDFTAKTPAGQAALKTAIDGITLGSPTTNLYGSAYAMLRLSKWVEQFDDKGIKTGFLVVLTDGEDTTGEKTLQQAMDERNIQKKQIFTVGLGASLNPTALKDLGNAGYYPVADVGQLAQTFGQIQESILDTANSFYWLNYASPKRGNAIRNLTISLKNNTNTGAFSTLPTTFNSDGFSDVAAGIRINRKSYKPEGDIDPIGVKIAKDKASVTRAFTMLGVYGAPNFTWQIADQTLATLTPSAGNGENVTITPIGNDGTTTLTVTDTVNFFTKSINLTIGSGVALPSQSISFAALGDRIPTSPPFTLTATASSGLPVSFAVVSGPAFLTGNTLTLTGTSGTVNLRASQAGNASYAIAPPVNRSFMVAPAANLASSWASSQGLSGGNAAMTARPYGDGVENTLKYAFNMKGNGPDVSVLAPNGSSGLPLITLDKSGPQPLLSVEFLRRKGSGLTYTPQRSTTLGGFTTMTGTPVVTPINDQWERVKIQEPALQTTTPKGFARVLVTLP